MDADSSNDCIICSEPLSVPGASLTKCGHVFHTACIERWFEQKALCPLCKTKASGEGFTRALLAPAPLSEDEIGRMRSLAASAGPGGVDAAARKLRDQSAAYAHETAVFAQAADVERQAVQHRMAAVHKLQSSLLKLKRELTAAQRVEANAIAAAADAEAEPSQQPLPPPPVLDADKPVSAEAVKQQTRQLAWRCQELRDLDEKIAAQERLQSIKRQRREQREAEAAASVT